MEAPAGNQEPFLRGIAAYFDRDFTPPMKYNLNRALHALTFTLFTNREKTTTAHFKFAAHAHHIEVVCHIKEFIAQRNDMPRILQFVMRANALLPVGGFTLVNDGRVLYKTELHCGSITDWQSAIAPLFETTRRIITYWAMGLNKLRDDPLVTPVAAIAHVVQTLSHVKLGAPPKLKAGDVKEQIERDGCDPVQKQPNWEHTSPMPRIPHSIADSVKMPQQGKTMPVRQHQGASVNLRGASVGGAGAGGGSNRAPTYLHDIISYSDLEEVDKLGSGGFGEVYQARWGAQDVAFKKIKGEVKPEVIEDFYQEANIMKVLTHPNIVIMMGLCLEPLGIVMEYMEKRSLNHELHIRKHPLSWELRIKWLLDGALGMGYLHSVKNITHGDMKPLNMLIDRNNVLKISDFGLSMVRQAAAGQSESYVRGVTYEYTAPEVLRTGRAPKPPADVFAYGLIIFEMHERKQPWKGFADPKLAIPAGTRPQIAKSIHAPLTRLMESCWHDDPQKRPDFRAIASQLRSMYDSKCWEHFEP